MPRLDNIDQPNTLTTKGISWTAVIAGALVALSLSFLVHALNAGLGLSAFTTDSTGMMVLAIGAMLWLILTGIVTMFIAGWVAGRLARRVEGDRYSGILHGFLAWSLALVIGLALTSSFLGELVKDADKSGNAVAHLTSQAGSEDKRALTPSKHTENVANTAGAAALGTFLVFLFGAVASGVGGYYGASNYRRFS